MGAAAPDRYNIAPPLTIVTNAHHRHVVHHQPHYHVSLVRISLLGSRGVNVQLISICFQIQICLEGLRSIRIQI